MLSGKLYRNKLAISVLSQRLLRRFRRLYLRDSDPPKAQLITKEEQGYSEDFTVPVLINKTNTFLYAWKRRETTNQWFQFHILQDFTSTSKRETMVEGEIEIQLGLIHTRFTQSNLTLVCFTYCKFWVFLFKNNSTRHHTTFLKFILLHYVPKLFKGNINNII